MAQELRRDESNGIPLSIILTSSVKRCLTFPGRISCFLFWVFTYYVVLQLSGSSLRQGSQKKPYQYMCREIIFEVLINVLNGLPPSVLPTLQIHSSPTPSNESKNMLYSLLLRYFRYKTEMQREGKQVVNS